MAAVYRYSRRIRNNRLASAQALRQIDVFERRRLVRRGVAVDEGDVHAAAVTLEIEGIVADVVEGLEGVVVGCIGKSHPVRRAVGRGTRLGVVFETATPFDTPRLTADLLAWTRQALARPTDIHPLLVIAVFVVAFLAVHPFEDGNGRLSRILTTLLLLRAGYAYVPYCSLESIIERSRDAYYLALRRTQATLRTDAPDWDPWLTYFLTALQRQKRHLQEKIERERLMLGDLPELSLRILQIARDHGRVTIRSAAAATGASRNTIKDHVRALTRDGLMTRHGSGRGTWYAPA